ncbi:unnamed protein product [Toxocara canis]|uniref:GDNF domain-containing protein n=1 Tax=Toxocara canis TaxID=6265 RepID=A0A183TYD6_TOXCA|nr:unnamed protein product [Toxocara canis]
MYPRCLYSDREMGPLTCTEAVEKCRRDNQCQRYSSLFFEYCPVHNGQCTVSELDHCRQAIIAIRGTYLEYPCYCPQNDPVCRKYQSGMLPNNPCVERSMLEYSRLMSDNLPSITDERHTHSSGESSHHKTDVVDERGNQKVTTATEASDHTRWRAGSSTGHVVVHADRNHQRFKQPTVQNGNAEQMPKSVSRINPDEKHYYKSETGVSPSLTDDTHEFDDSDVEPLERRRQPTSIKSSVDNRKTGAHRMTSEERMKASAEHKGSDAKQKSVISSPRIVGTTFVSADDGLSKPDKSVQDMHPSTSEPFVLLTQKHRNLTLATNDTTSKSSTKMIKATTRISLRPSTSGPYVTHAPPPLGTLKPHVNIGVVLLITSLQVDAQQKMPTGIQSLTTKDPLFGDIMTGQDGVPLGATAVRTNVSHALNCHACQKENAMHRSPQLVRAEN